MSSGKQVADVQAVGGGIEAGVDGARFFGEPGREVGVVGGLMNEVAPAEIVEKHLSDCEQATLRDAVAEFESCARFYCGFRHHGVCLLH